MALYFLSVLCLLLAGHSHGRLTIISVGDWGDIFPSGIQNQKIVADAMDAWCGTHVCEFILNTGDNFYQQGVTSVDDSRWETSWLNVYTGANIATKTWYISIGNHDHDSYAGGATGDGREQFQVDYYYQIEPRWVFPALWYDFVYDDGTVTVHFIVLDSQSLKYDKNDPASQYAWYEATLAASTANWKIVVIHHPPYSSGNYGPTDQLIIDNVVPLAEQYNVDVMLSGHDHNLQHLTKTGVTDGIDYVITGGGGRGLYAQEPAAVQGLIDIGYQIDYFGYTYGFTSMVFTATTMDVDHVNTTGTVVYSFSRTK